MRTIPNVIKIEMAIDTSVERGEDGGLGDRPFATTYDPGTIVRTISTKNEIGNSRKISFLPNPDFLRNPIFSENQL